MPGHSLFTSHRSASRSGTLEAFIGNHFAHLACATPRAKQKCPDCEFEVDKSITNGWLLLHVDVDTLRFMLQTRSAFEFDCVNVRTFVTDHLNRLVFSDNATRDVISYNERVSHDLANLIVRSTFGPAECCTGNFLCDLIARIKKPQQLALFGGAFTKHFSKTAVNLLQYARQFEDKIERKELVKILTYFSNFYKVSIAPNGAYTKNNIEEWISTFQFGQLVEDDAQAALYFSAVSKLFFNGEFVKVVRNKPLIEDWIVFAMRECSFDAKFVLSLEIPVQTFDRTSVSRFFESVLTRPKSDARRQIFEFLYEKCNADFKKEIMVEYFTTEYSCEELIEANKSNNKPLGDNKRLRLSEIELMRIIHKPNLAIDVSALVDYLFNDLELGAGRFIMCFENAIKYRTPNKECFERLLCDTANCLQVLVARKYLKHKMWSDFMRVYANCEVIGGTVLMFLKAPEFVMAPVEVRQVVYSSVNEHTDSLALVNFFCHTLGLYSRADPANKPALKVLLEQTMTRFEPFLPAEDMEIVGVEYAKLEITGLVVPAEWIFALQPVN